MREGVCPKLCLSLLNVLIFFLCECYSDLLVIYLLCFVLCCHDLCFSSVCSSRHCFIIYELVDLMPYCNSWVKENAIY